MRVDNLQLDHVVKRLKRAQGQLGGIIKMIEEGRDCEDVVTQIAAVGKAVDRAGVAVISAGMRECFTSDATESADDAQRLEKLFLSLV